MSSHLGHLQTVLCSSVGGSGSIPSRSPEARTSERPCRRSSESPGGQRGLRLPATLEKPSEKKLSSGAAFQGPRQAVPSRASRAPLPTGRTTCFVKSASSKCQASAGAILLARQSLRLNARLESQCHRRIKVHSKHATKSHFQRSIRNGPEEEYTV